MKIAVVGGSGFIGTHLVPLLRKKHDVIIIDKARSLTFPALWRFGDVRDPASLAPHLAGVDWIINLAAEHKDNVRPTGLYYDVNVQGARHLCQAAERLGIRNIFFTSSVAVYGAARDRTENNRAPAPTNHYGRSKWQAEQVYRDWQRARPGRSLRIVRPTVVFGENNRGNVYNLLRQVHAMPYLTVGSGRNIKSMAYVENVAAFIAAGIEAPPGYGLSNYVDKPDVAVRELFYFVKRLVNGRRGVVIHVPFIIGYLIGRLFDFLAIVTGREFPVSSLRMKKLVASTRYPAGADAGFRAPFTLREGLERTIRHEFLNQKTDAVIFESE